MLDDVCFTAVWQLVRSVPFGRVVTYGQLAQTVTIARLTPRQVGGIMRQAPSDVPWHRVVGAGGRLPIARRSPELRAEQRALLLAEGVPFSRDGEVVAMASAQWPLDEDGQEQELWRRERRDDT